MNTKMRDLLLIAGMLILGGCSTSSPETAQVPASSTSKPENTSTQFLESDVLPKPKIFPLYPNSQRGGTYARSPATDWFMLNSNATMEEIFTFYDQQLPQYGWQRHGWQPDTSATPETPRFSPVLQNYRWHSDDPTVEWDVIASVQRHTDAFSNKVTAAISFYKDARLDKLPIYPGARIETESTTGSGNQRAVQIIYQANQTLDEIVSYYQKNLPNLGWEGQIADNNQTGVFKNMRNTEDAKLLMLAFEKLPNQAIQVTLQAQDKPVGSETPGPIPTIPPFPNTPTP